MRDYPHLELILDTMDDDLQATTQLLTDSELADTVGTSEPAGSTRTADTPVSESWEGRSLGHFTLQRQLGVGGMGSVWRALDTSLNRVVALKLLPAELTADPTLVARFVREAQTQARVSHPNVVPIYFVGEDDGQHYFAMEVVDGESLDDLLQRGETVGWAEAISLMEDIARALAECRQRGLIHRDIKPGNILVSAQGVIKVADFGLAKPLDIPDEDEEATPYGSGPDLKLTAAGTILGTPLYAAPEQMRGRDIDHRADIYGLGATFFHLISGAPLFLGDSAVSTMLLHATEEPNLDRLPADVPDALRDVLWRMLRKDPADRFANYDELIDALGKARPTTLPSANIRGRALAAAIDLLLTCWPSFAATISLIRSGHTSPIPLLLSVYLWPLVFGLLHAVTGATGHRTIGQLLLSHRVVTADGSRPRLRAMVVRSAILSIPLAIALLSYTYNNYFLFTGLALGVLIALDGDQRDDKRTFADRASKTRVVRTR